jgi:predicted nucleic acid-binding Zn ribbon protein
MFCPTCGKEIPNDSTLCPACGAKLASGKKERRPKLRIILPVVFVLVLLAASLAVYQVIRTHAGKDQKLAALIPYRKGDKWGFCDRDRKMVIPAVYDSVDLFSDGLAQVELNLKFGFVDTKGNMVIPAVYEWVESFSEGRAIVSLNDKRGYIDTKGNLAIPIVYSGTYPFSEGLAAVTATVKLSNNSWGWGFVNSNGKMVVPAVYDTAYPFSEGLAQVELNLKWG